MADQEEGRSTPPVQRPTQPPFPTPPPAPVESSDLSSTPLPLRADTVAPVRPSDSGEVGSWASATPYVSPPVKVVASDALASGVTEAAAQAETIRRIPPPDFGASASLRPVEAMLRDPLGEVARKERRSLLGISAIAILVGWTGLVPAKIENFGISFAAPERKGLLWVFVAVVLYYTVAFIIYSFSDFLSYLYAVHQGRVALRKQREEQPPPPISLARPEQPVDAPWSLIGYVTPASLARGVFDFLVPLVVAGVAIWSLLGAVTQVATNVPTAPAAPAVAPAPSLKTPPAPTRH